MAAVLKERLVASSELMRFGFAGARARALRQPMLQRLGAPDVGAAEYAQAAMRLLLAYRRIEHAMQEHAPREGASFEPFVSRADLLEQDLERLGHRVGSPTDWHWPGPSGPNAHIGMRCALLDLELSGASLVEPFRQAHPEIWDKASRYWRFIGEEQSQAMSQFARADELMTSSAALHAATRAGIAALEVFYAYLSA